MYNDHLTQLTVAEAAVALPLSVVERSTHRHRAQDRPPLPASRRDLVLQLEHSVTSDGRAFVLIDDGLDDRILVFVTEEQLQRLV